MKNNCTIRNRLLYLFIAFVFTLGTLFVCFRSLEYKVALADTNTNVLMYNGSPYSTVITNSYAFDIVSGNTPLYVRGSNFQIENNFVLDKDTYKYYLYANAKDTGRLNTYFVGYDFNDVDEGGSVYMVKYRSTSSSYTGNYANVINIFSSELGFNQNEIHNYHWRYLAVPGYSSSGVYNDRYYEGELMQDNLGFYYNFKYGVRYYLYLGYYAENSSDTDYYRTIELYCPRQFSNVNQVSISNSKTPITIFNYDLLQSGFNWDSIKFSYYGDDLNNDYLSVNCYAYRTMNTNWNESLNYDYSRNWFNVPNLSESAELQQAYENGKAAGLTEGQNAAYKKGLDEGYANGKRDWRAIGYAEGVADAGDYTFLSLLGAVVDAPITAVTGLLNFDLLGFNMANFFYALITIAIIIFVVRLVMAK